MQVFLNIIPDPNFDWVSLYQNHVLPAAESLSRNDILFLSGLSFFSIWGVFLFILLPSTKKIFGVISLSIALLGAGLQLNQVRIKSSQPATVEKLLLLDLLDKSAGSDFILVRQIETYSLSSHGLEKKVSSPSDVYRAIPTQILSKLDQDKFFFVVFIDVIKPLVYIQKGRMIW
jgi:hypothetical protein